MSAYAEEGKNSTPSSNVETTSQTDEVVAELERPNYSAVSVNYFGDRGGFGSFSLGSITRGPINSSLSGRTVARGGNEGLKNFNALDKNTTNVVANKNNAFSQTSPPAGQGASLKNTQDRKGSEERHDDKSEKENNRQDQDFYNRIQEGDRWR